MDTIITTMYCLHIKKVFKYYKFIDNFTKKEFPQKAFHNVSLLQLHLNLNYLLIIISEFNFVNYPKIKYLLAFN